MDLDTGLYDSATGETLKALEVVDVTAQQKGAEKAELVFMRAKRGRIVQLRHDGARIHYFMDERGGRQMMAEDCARFGFLPDALLTLADQYAPE